jgi:hypothetical protein
MDNSIQPQEELISQSNPTPIQDGKPYFLGNHALVRFSGGEGGFGPEIYWLVDKEDHTIRPFESDMALDATFGDELESALKNAVTIASPMIDQDGEITEGVLADFSLLGPEYIIREDGSTKPIGFSSYQLKGRYGKPIDENIEGLATEAVDGFLNLLKNNEKKTNIPSSFISELKRDNKLMAFYISSMAYGNYTLSDIYSDISQRFYNKE